MQVTPSHKPTRQLVPHELPLLFAVCLDLMGFGMILPDLQTRMEAFGAKGLLIGSVYAVYFLVQMTAAPMWGRWSDKAGRKPVLLLCGLLSSFSMGLYALSSGVGLIVLSRILAGLGGGNVTAAQAYLADATPENLRTQAMGRLGAATTAGLILGPAIGGWLSSSGGHLLLGSVASGLSLLGSVWIFLAVPSVAPRPKSEEPNTPLPSRINLLRAVPALRPVFLLAASAYFALSCLEGTFGRLIHQTLGAGALLFGLIFGYEALLGVISQTVLLSWLSERLRPKTLISMAYLLQGVGLALMPFAPNVALLFGASTLFGIGAGLANPILQSLASRLAPAERQGEMFGVLQSVRSVGFLAGPILGGVLFDVRPMLPYLLAGSVMLLSGLSAMRLQFVESEKE